MFSCDFFFIVPFPLVFSVLPFLVALIFGRNEDRVGSTAVHYGNELVSICSTVVVLLVSGRWRAQAGPQLKPLPHLQGRSY